MPRIRVLLVDDFKMVVEGVRSLLAGAGDFQIVGECSAGNQVLEEAERTAPDIVLLDLRLPGVLAPELCRDLLAARPGLRIVILTGYDDRELIHACLAAGAAGVLLKDVHELDLVRALRDVHAGRMVVDERVAAAPTNGDPVRTSDGAVFTALTPREYEVLRMFARGMTSREIADALGLAVNTVRSYSQSLLAKLQAHNRIQALEAARRLHLI